MLTARGVADLVGGRLQGSGEREADGVAPLDTAGPRHLSFVSGHQYLAAFRASQAGMVLVPEALASVEGGPVDRIVVRDPRAALSQVLEALGTPEAGAVGIDPTARLGQRIGLGTGVGIGPWAVLGDGVRLGAGAQIGAGVVLEDGVLVGPDSRIGPRVFCGRGTTIGARVIIQPGAVIGAPGFGYLTSPDGHRRIPHPGRCVIEDDVEVGANCCIDRGSVGDTVIGQGTKLDNLVHIAHNVRIGRRCLILGQVGIAGSTVVGDGAILAGQVGVSGHLRIGDGARAAAQAGIIGDVEAGIDVTGFPARGNREFLRSQAVLYRLVPLIKDLEALVQERKRNG